MLSLIGVRFQPDWGEPNVRLIGGREETGRQSAWPRGARRLPPTRPQRRALESLGRGPCQPRGAGRRRDHDRRRRALRGGRVPRRARWQAACRDVSAAAAAASSYPEAGSAGAVAATRDSNGHVIPQGRAGGLWVRWWSRIRFIRFTASVLWCCSFAVLVAVASMCARAGRWAASRCPRTRPIVALSPASGH